MVSGRDCPGIERRRQREREREREAGGRAGLDTAVVASEAGRVLGLGFGNVVQGPGAEVEAEVEIEVEVRTGAGGSVAWGLRPADAVPADGRGPASSCCISASGASSGA